MALRLKSSNSMVQNLVDIPPERIPLYKYTLSVLDSAVLNEALGGSPSSSLDRYIGIAPIYSSGQSGKLQYLTLAAGHRALVLQMGGLEHTLCGRQVLEDLFTHADHVVLGFDIAEVATALYKEQKISFSNFVDIQDMLPIDSRAPLQAVKMAVECADRIWPENVVAAFRRPFLAGEPGAMSNSVLRAWLSAYIARCAASCFPCLVPTEHCPQHSK
jgi:hypothetical protein